MFVGAHVTGFYRHFLSREKQSFLPRQALDAPQTGENGVDSFIGAFSAGLDSSQEAEGHDKTSLLLPGTQLAMVRAVTAAAAASKRPVVAVVMGGSAVDLSELKVRYSIKTIN